MERSHHYGDEVTMGDGCYPVNPVHEAEPMNWEDDGSTVTVGLAEQVAASVAVPVGKTFTVVDPHQQQILFGGVTNREALAMVTAEELAAELLKRVNPDWSPAGDHSKDTPKRFVASLKELCGRPEKFKFTTFYSDVDEMVTMGPIPFYTLCAHHVVPFHGQAWIGYVPNGKLCGLSKLARTVKYVAKGMWVQEGLTAAIHNYINQHMDNKGIAVVLRAEHMCMSMRGVQIAGAITTTAKMSGVFGEHDRTAKAEFLTWMEMSK